MMVFGHLSAAWMQYRKHLRLALNGIVTLGLGYALYRQFFVVNDVNALVEGFRQNLPAGFLPLLAVVAGLMPANLALEAYKLRVALPDALRSTWRQTLGQVCGGIAVGLWTPGRVGEFAGRLAGTYAAQRAPMLSATAIGGIAQWSPLLIGGGAALLFWRQASTGHTAAATDGYALYLQNYLQSSAASGVGALAIGIGVLTAVLFWRAPAIVRYVSRVRMPGWLSAVARSLRVAQLGSRDFLAALEGARGGLFVASVARYVVYLLQMSLAFVAFGLPVGVLSAVVGTATLLLLHGFLPVPPALQAVARIEFAVLLFGYADPNEVSIAAASLFIFALNLGLPALIGWLFIVRRNVKNYPLPKA